MIAEIGTGSGHHSGGRDDPAVAIRQAGHALGEDLRRLVAKFAMRDEHAAQRHAAEMFGHWVIVAADHAHLARHI